MEVYIPALLLGPSQHDRRPPSSAVTAMRYSHSHALATFWTVPSQSLSQNKASSTIVPFWYLIAAKRQVTNRVTASYNTFRSPREGDGGRAVCPQTDSFILGLPMPHRPPQCWQGGRWWICLLLIYPFFAHNKCPTFFLCNNWSQDWGDGSVGRVLGL